MAERHAIMRLNRELALLERSSSSQFVARPSDSDTMCWHYMIFNMPAESPYYGGQYHGKLVFPKEYPLKPPSIYMLTPSGRFEVNTRLCLSMSDFHPESWNPSWRIETILLGLISFMLDESDPTTAGGIRSSRQNRVNEAKLSFFRNRLNKDICMLFPELTDSSRYFIGVGYIHSTVSVISAIPEGFKSLKDMAVGDSELSLIQSSADLNLLLLKCGIKDSNNSSGFSSKGSKSILNNVMVWVISAALLYAWLNGPK